MNEPIQNNLKIKKVFNSSLPVFWNFSLDKGRLKSFVSWFLKHHGEKKTIQLLEKLKELGFGYATRAGISLGIEDLKIPPKKSALLGQAEVSVSKSLLAYRRGEVTGIEKMQLFIETWHETSENLKQEVVQYFEQTNILNPVYMMAFSGARGNLSQVRQLVGMRGLMADPQGKIIDFPIQSNFREGLTLTEYLISTYGARKGIVDTALRTATAGYLTRRLVDVAQHVIVSKFDCGTQRGIFLFDMKDGNKTIYFFQNRLTGRVLAQDIPSVSNPGKLNASKTFSLIGSRNQEITLELAAAISKVTKKALVRSPLTCETRKLVCQLCYGWSLATSRLVSIGEAVGVIAGQSIGEPGTQLTMRTFHTGGVFSGGVTEQINAPFDAIIEYQEPISGTCIRTPQGGVSFLTKAPGTIFAKRMEMENIEKISDLLATQENLHSRSMNIYKIPAFTILFARHGQSISKGNVLAQISSLPVGQTMTQIIEQTIYSALEGEVYYSQIDILEDIDEKYGERVSKAEDWSTVWVLSGKIYQDPLTATFFPIRGDYLSKNVITHQIQWLQPFSQASVVDSRFHLVPSSPNSEYSLDLKKKANFVSLNFEKKGLEFDGFMPSFHFETSMLNSKTESRKFCIFPKRSIKQNFFSDLSFFNKQKQKIETWFCSNKKTSSFPSLTKIQTSFVYPFQITTTRYAFLKILGQTFVSLPMLQPGFLKQWIETNNSTSQTNKKKKNVALEYVNLKNNVVFVKKLNMNKKFRIYDSAQTNFFHPLILSNFFPFIGISKTLKGYLKRKSVLDFSNLNTSNFYLLNQDISGERLQTHAFKTFIDFKKKSQTFLFNQHKETKSKTNLFTSSALNLNLKNTNFKLQKSSNPKWLTSIVKKAQSQPFEHLFVKHSILSLKTKNVCYQKLGYVLSVPMKSDQTDQFFSFLPLKGDSFVESTKRNFLNYSSKVRSFEDLKAKSQLSPKHYKTNIIGWKNTDQWAPSPQQACYWFPNFSQTRTGGLFIYRSPFIAQTIFRNTFFKFKPKNLKNLSAYTKKYISFFNVAQSQFIKKKHKLNHFKVFLNSNLSNNTLLKLHSFHKSTENTIVSRFPTRISEWTILNKQKRFDTKVCLNSTKQNKNKELEETSLRLIKYQNFFKKPKPFLEKKNLADKSILLKQLEKQNFKQVSNSKYLKINKLSSQGLKTQNLLYSKLSNETKVKFLSKKTSKKFTSIESLITKFKFSQKSTVSYNEMYWLPQENYHLNMFSNSTFVDSHKQKSFYFVSNSGAMSHTKDFPKFYLSNSQGFKKPLLFKLEGLLQIQNRNFLNFKHSKFKTKPIENKKNFMTKKIKTLLQQNFVTNLNQYPTPEKPRLESKVDNAIINGTVQQFDSSLKRKFVNYLKRHMRLKKALLNSGTVEKNVNRNLTKSCSFVCTKRNSSNESFSFVPFIQSKNLSVSNRETKTTLQEFFWKMDSTFLTKLKMEPVRLSIKRGWIYKTTTLSSAFSLHKIWLNPGHVLLDDLSFEQQKVFIEIISFTPPFEKSFSDKIHSEIKKTSFPNFQASSFVANTNARFFNRTKDFKTNNISESSLPTHPAEILFLIRPLNHSILPNTHQMKRNLYIYMQKIQVSAFTISYQAYKKYRSHELNQQKNTLRTISNFAPVDMQITWIDPSRSAFGVSSTVSKNKSVRSSLKSKLKKGKKDQLNRTTWNFSFERFLSYFYPKNNQSFSLTKNFSHCFGNFLYYKFNKRGRNTTEESVHVSYYPLNFLSFKISLNLQDLNLHSYSYPHISLNFIPNRSVKDFSDPLQNHYLSLLLNRKLTHPVMMHSVNLNNLKNLNNKWNSLKNLNSQKLVGVSPNGSSHFYMNLKDSKRRNSGQRCITLSSCLTIFSSTPFFEFSLYQTYSYLANQRFFASYFYNRQVQDYLKLSFLNHVSQVNETFHVKKFITKPFASSPSAIKAKGDKTKNFSDSSRGLPLSKNHFVLSPGPLKNTEAFSFTSFYSPFKGEVLKICSEDQQNVESLKKGFNAYLENGFLHERKMQKLILTKSDFFSLKLPRIENIEATSESTVKIERNLFNQTENQNQILTKNVGSLNLNNEKLTLLNSVIKIHQKFKNLEKTYYDNLDLKKYTIREWYANYKTKRYKLKNLYFGLSHRTKKLRLGEFILPGDYLYSNLTFLNPGQIIHLNSEKLTLRKAQLFSISPQAILHTYNGNFVTKNSPVMTLPFQTLKTGDIVQGIPKVEQYLEARTTIRGRLFLNSLPVLLYAIYQRYSKKLNMEKAVRQSFLKIQQILVDGVQRVYRSQGVSIADKHLEIIVRQMTSKVKVIHGGQTGFFSGELVDLEFVERINRFLMVKIRYEPVVLGITRASLEVDSFLSAASFQQTTKVLTRSAIENKRDFLKGLKENLLVGNLLPAGTGYIVPISEQKNFKL